jgi:hypothetical protein
MPINYQQIQAQSNQFCIRALKHNQAISRLTNVLMDALTKYEDHQTELQQLVERETQTNQSLRCAIPYRERITTVHKLPASFEPVMIIAADGSQINPSRHRQVDFGLINVATICIRPGLDIPPKIESESRLLDDFNQQNGQTRLTDDRIALERDILERAFLLNQARKYPAPLITITDGPLEIFRETGETVWFEKKLLEYFQILGECRNSSIVTAGYVDKPHSDLVNHLLRLALEKLPISGLSLLNETEEVHVPDACLFSGLLSVPGDRSAVFAIQSQWARHFKDELHLCFFYLNVGLPSKPSLARVELPAWCAENSQLLDNLHGAIFRQCEIMGTRPYPYILHRAHELAVVTYEEAAHLENMLATELNTRGIEVGVKSNKQSAKDLPGRGRYP